MHRWILAVASRLVPKSMRAEWRAEWDAELFHHTSRQARSARAPRLRLDLVRRTAGAFWDALWLQSSRWYSLRLFGRHWRMALAAVLSLGTAIAATTIGFAAYNALLLRPPGVSDPGSLVFIHAHTTDDPFGAMSYPEYRDYREQARAFSAMTAFPYAISNIGFTGANRTEHVIVTQVSPDFFQVLGIKPRLGGLTMRTAPEREVDDVVLSEVFWRKLGGDPQIVGSTIKLNWRWRSSASTARSSTR